MSRGWESWRGVRLAGAVMVIGLGVVASPSPAAAAGPGVVHAQNWTGDPGAGGAMVAQEWLAVGLAPGEESVRRETSDGVVTTRTDVPCGSGSSSGALCPEVRQVTLPSTDGEIPPTYSRTRGAFLGDPNIPQPSDLAATATLSSQSLHPTATGPLGDALAGWQVPPPGHGSTYERFDVPSSEGTDSEWLDSATSLPLKVSVQSGTTSTTTYWTYTPSLIAAATLGPQFFAQTPPATPGLSEQTDYSSSGRPPSSVTDPSQGATFAPLSLGDTTSVGGQTLCLASSDQYTYSESASGFADPENANWTRVDTSYVPLAAGASCRPGHGDASNASVEILSFPKSSAIATENRNAFAGAQTLHLQLTASAARAHARRRATAASTPASLQVMAGAGDADALGLIDVGNTTILLRSNLVDPLNTGQIPQAILGLVRPALARKGYRVRLPRTAQAAESITNGHWLFTGSIYDQSSGTPNRNKRLDPVSVIWKGGGSASINNVRNYTQGYWKESAIPSGYPGGAQMKPRDDNPLCRDAHYVWFRYNGASPNAGKWEQSDGRGYMSTNGLCANQYHIRMWSSRALYDLTGSHLLEFVLAPIHHDHTTVCWVGPIPYPCHGRPDLSFDKARYVYAKVMGASVCTFIHWKVNPESEGFNYQGYLYSGYVSRMTFWVLVKHPTCRGV